MKKKEKFEFELWVPVAQYWVYRVMAYSNKDAIKRWENNDDTLEQNCEMNAKVGSRKIIVYECDEKGNIRCSKKSNQNPKKK